MARRKTMTQHTPLKIITLLLAISLNAQSAYLSVERYPDSDLKDFVTHCDTKLECYKKFQWAVATGKFVECKKATIIENDINVWQVDFEKNKVWQNRQQQVLWGE
jgi:hypothetical protein